MRTIVGDTEEFLITVDLNQGLALGFYFVCLVMDELTNITQNEVDDVYFLLMILC